MLASLGTAFVIVCFPLYFSWVACAALRGVDCVLSLLLCASPLCPFCISKASGLTNQLMIW